MENSDGQHPTILIVEDIDWIRFGMKRAIERQGYRTVEARNDAEAFQFAGMEAINLIVTEEKLPTFDALMDGLPEYPTLSSLPVVIVNPDTEDGARLGDVYLLADYADISSLLAVLRG